MMIVSHHLWGRNYYQLTPHILSRLFVITLCMSHHVAVQNNDEVFHEGLTVILDEPYDGAIYIRSIYDPFNSGVVDPAGRFTIRFHVECSRETPKIEGCVLQGQINTVWVTFGPLTLECGGKYLTSVQNMWPPIGDDGEDAPATTSTRAPRPPGGLLNGINSFGLFVIVPDG
jgi:hypothetical protein